MIRIRQLTAVLAAVVMTAVTFAQIGTGSTVRNTVYSAQAMSLPLSVAVGHAAALLHNVMHALI